MIAPVIERHRQIPSAVTPMQLTVAVSGASGLVGSALSASLVERNDKVRRVVRSRQSLVSRLPEPRTAP